MCLSVRTKLPGNLPQFRCEAFVCQNRNSSRYLPNWARGVFPSEPKFLAIVTSLNARCFSARAKIRGNISRFKCEAFVSQNRNPGRYLPLWMRGVFRSEPKFLAILPSLRARRLSVGTEIPGNSYQFEFEVFVSQNPNSWQITNLHARCLSVRAKIPGGFFQFECEALSYQNRSSWRYLPGYVGGVFRAGAKSLAVFTSLIARRFSIRTEIPGVIYRFECEVFVGQGPNAWRRFHV